MTLSVTTPEITTKKLRARDLVISILAVQHPLTLVKIKNAIHNKFGASVTFQGVRKAANQLTEEDILEKKGREYSINKDWIQQLRDFAERLEQEYYSETTVRDVQALGDDIKVYTFNNLIDADQFLNRLITTWFEDQPGLQYLQKAGHAYFMVGNLEEENRINDVMRKNKVTFYTLVGGKTTLDHWAGSYFQKQGFRYKKGEGDTSKYFAVYGDRLFQYETDEKHTRKIDRVYATAKKIEDLDVAALISLLRENVGIRVTVMRSPLLAEQLRKLILSHFKR